MPGALLVQLYRRPAEPPSKATIWRVVNGADAAAVDAAISAWLLQRASSRAAPFGENPAGEAAGQGGTGDGPAHHHHDHHDHGDHHDHDAAAGSSKLLAIAVDGKTVRGATDAEGNQPHLLAAATHHDALSSARLRSVRRPTRSRCSPRFSTSSPPTGSTWPTP